MQKRTKHYDYDAWLSQGLRLQDYDSTTGEFILSPFPPTITAQQARLLSYSSVYDLSEREFEIVFGK